MLTQAERNNEELIKYHNRREDHITIHKKLEQQKVKVETEMVNKV